MTIHGGFEEEQVDMAEMRGMVEDKIGKEGWRQIRGWPYSHTKLLEVDLGQQRVLRSFGRSDIIGLGFRKSPLATV